MNLPRLFSRSNCTVPLLARDLKKFGSLLRWNNYREDVLDVGCASGYITRTVLYPNIKHCVHKLISVDKRQCMIDFAKEHNQFERIEYQLMDVTKREQVEKMKSKFDRIFVPLVAHWIPDNRVLLNMLRIMLKPKGQFFLTTFVDTPLHKSFLKLGTEQTWAKYLPNEDVLYDYGANPCKFLTDLAMSAGFKVDVCESEEGYMTMEHYSDLIKAIVHFYDKIALIPEELKEDYFADHLKYSLKFCTYLDEPDKIDYPYQKMVCIATKTD